MPVAQRKFIATYLIPNLEIQQLLKTMFQSNFSRQVHANKAFSGLATVPP